MASSPAPGVGILLFVFFFSLQPQASKVCGYYTDVLSQDPPQSQAKALVAPVVKDPSTLQYTLRLHQGKFPVPVDLTLHLGGALMWLDCAAPSTSYSPVHCRSLECAAAARHHAPSSSHGDRCIVSAGEGKNGRFSLPSHGELAEGAVSIAAADDEAGSLLTSPQFLFSCATGNSRPSSPALFHGLAAGSRGVAGLGRDHLSLPSQLAANFSLPRKFGVCLPASSSPSGAIFFGDAEPRDASMDLAYTPLLTNPASRNEYFIGVTSIRVNDKPVEGINTTLLTVGEDGVGGTKISTVHPYTVLETSIYRAVAGAFARESGLARVRVPRTPAAPFKHCFFSHGGGAKVPPVDLVLQSERVAWRISADKSVVQVRPGLLCLAFLDGGRHGAMSVLLGGYQLEDVFLQFDLAASRLGFSSSVRARQTGCHGFKSTAET